MLMLSVADALELVLQNTPTGAAERVSLTEALHRTLAAEQVATMDSPPFDKALMDGFAVSTSARHDGVAAVTLTVAEQITAGVVPAIAVDDVHATRIMTGAPLPDGCDCVVPIEATHFEERHPETVTIPVSAIRSGANLMRQGTAAVKGSSLLSAGTRLMPPQLAALAESGIAQVDVYRQPRVAVMATGDELVAFDQPVRAGQIRNSNEPMLVAQVACCDAVPVSLGVARDDADALFNLIRRGLEADVLLLTGGVSAGVLDLVPQQLERAGVSRIFHGVNMKPGKPLWFGRAELAGRSCVVFGLPGNPVSSLACFELFVRPAIGALQGHRVPSPMRAELAAGFSVSGSRPVYHPAALWIADGRLQAKPVAWSGSSDLRATVEANGMVLLEPDHGPYATGERVPAFSWGATFPPVR